MDPNLYGGLEAPAGQDKEATLSMGGGRAQPKHVPDRTQYVVTFDEPHDPLNPQHWATWRK